MLVKIHTKEFKGTFYLPNTLLFNRLGLSIALMASQKYVKVSETGKEALLAQLKRYRKQFKGLTLVEVKTSEGEEILVKL